MKNQTTKGILLSILFASMYLQTMSQNYCITDQFNFGGSDDDIPVSIIKITDGYVICGWTNSNDGDFNVPVNRHIDGFIAKFNNNNQLIWRHTYGGTSREDFYSIKQTDDGGFIAGGSASSHNGDVSGNHGGQSDAWVVKFDALGLIQWQHCYGGNGIDYINEINIVPSGYVILGETKTNNNGDVPANHGDYDAWVFSISTSGTLINSFCYGGSGYDAAISYIQNSNGTFTFSGETQSNDGDVSGNHGASDKWLVNANTDNGNINWQKCLGGSGNDFGNGFVRTTDGNIVLNAGSSSDDGDVDGNGGLFVAWLVKVNPTTGNIIWNKTYKKDNINCGMFGVTGTSDGGVLATGIVTSQAGVESANDAYVLKVNSDGTKQWEKILGGSQADMGGPHRYSGIEVGNQYIIPFVSASSDGDVLNAHGGFDAWIVTLGTGGCNNQYANKIENNLSNEAAIPKHRAHELAIGEIEKNLSNGVAIFPNPVTNTTTISFSLLQTGNVSVKIFDVNGRLVSTLADKMFEEGENEIIWNAAEANAGIYFLQFHSAENLQTEKLIVTK